MDTQTTSEWSIETQRRRTRLLDHLLLSAVVLGLVAMALLYVPLLETMDAPERLTTMVPFVVGWLVVVILSIWRGTGYWVRALTLVILAYILGIIIFARGGLAGSGRVWLLLSPALAFILLGPRPGIVAGAVSVLTYAFFTLAISQGWVVPQVAEDLTTLAPLVTEGGAFLLVTIILTLVLWSFNRSWLDALAGANAAHGQLQAWAQELEAANERLRRQTSQLQATAAIARAGSSILDPQELLAEVVNGIRREFGATGVYYAGLFLLDETEQFAVLRAATGETGQPSMERDYKLELDETSTVGQCIIHRQARVALVMGETVAQSDALPTPYTRSEIALPLHSRGRILGALSVHSTREAAFSEADVAILQTMADQVGVAIDNAMLFSQTRAALDELEAIQRRYQVQAWRDFLTTRQVAQIDYTRQGTEPASETFLRQARRAAMVHERTVATSSSSPGTDGQAPRAALVVPLKLRGQVIGTMALHETDRQRLWTAEEIALAETVAEQAVLTVENLRLMDETQRRAAREQLVSQITGRVWASLDPDTILKTTVRELGRALGARMAAVEITAPGSDGGDSPIEEPARGEEE